MTYQLPRIILVTSIAASALFLAGCASASSPGATGADGSTAATPGAPAAAATGDGACAAISSSELAALITVPVGKPYNALAGNAGSFDCEYGVGSNAGLTGAAVQTVESDTILITRYGQLGKQQYTTSTAAVTAGSLIQVAGLGDEASYWNGFGGAPKLFAYKGDVDCEISLNLSDASEAGATAGDQMSEADAAVVVTKEVPICASILASK